MPHPAIVRRVVIPLQSDLITASSYSPWTSHQYGSEFSSFTAHEEPESTSNPLRSDGTRPPAAYYAKNVVVINGFAPCQTQHAIGWYVKSGNPAPRFARFGSNPSTKTVIDWFVEPVGFDVENRAKTKFLLALNERKGAGQVQLGVAAGEFLETVNMAVSLAVGITVGVRTLARKFERSSGSINRVLHRASKIGVKNTLVEVARKHGNAESRIFERIIDGWLVYQLGLKPLAHDIYDATLWLKAAQGPDGTLSLPVTVKAGATGTYKYSKLLCEHGLNGSIVDIWADISQVVKIDYSCVYKIPSKAGYAEQLGVDNPGAVLWNLVKYTWLIDYAFGVGDWLTSMTAANNTEFLEGSMSRKRVTMVDELRSEYPPVLEGYYGTLVKDPAKGHCLVDIQLFEREVLYAGVMPAALPGLKNKLSLTKLANVLSVLKNFL